MTLAAVYAVLIINETVCCNTGRSALASGSWSAVTDRNSAGPSGLLIAQAYRAHRAKSTTQIDSRTCWSWMCTVPSGATNSCSLPIAARTKHGIRLLASRIRESHEELGHLGLPRRRPRIQPGGRAVPAGEQKTVVKGV